MADAIRSISGSGGSGLETITVMNDTGYIISIVDTIIPAGQSGDIPIPREIELYKTTYNWSVRLMIVYFLNIDHLVGVTPYRSDGTEIELFSDDGTHDSNTTFDTGCFANRLLFKDVVFSPGEVIKFCI